MANLNGKIKQYLIDNGKIYEDEKNNYQLQNDSGTDYIKSWNVSGLTEPNDSQLNSYDSAVTTEKNNNTVIANRKSEYGTTEQQIENIIENGLSAEQTRVQAIKDKYPKE